MIKVSLISLGCAKNLVDSEIMVGHLHKAGMTVVPDAEKADVVIVNTCSFIDSSKEESIGHILEVHQNRGLRKRRKEQKLIVAGCMSQRFSKDLSGELAHEVDAFIGSGSGHAGRARSSRASTKRNAERIPFPKTSSPPSRPTSPTTTRRVSGSPRGISPTSRSPRAAITRARSASSRRSGVGIAVARSRAWSPRRASWSPKECGKSI
jgi:tRNA A37 methylthiotransferase MiaB